MKQKHVITGLIIFLLSIMIVSPALAQEEESEECQHPVVAYLVESTEATCQEILDMHAQDIGYGQMMKAVIIADAAEAEWTELLETHQEGDIGWGQISRAYMIAAQDDTLGLTAEDLLALREEDMGWGQIMHAQALASADLGASFEEAVAMMQAGMGWGEIRDELGLEAGPPPWAGPDHNNGIGNGNNGNNGQGIGNNGNNGQGNGNSGNGNNGNNGQGNGNNGQGNGNGKGNGGG